jgi:hypothetical protein
MIYVSEDTVICASEEPILFHERVYYNMPSSLQKTQPRRWYLDALSALAFLALGILLLRPLKAIPALAVFVVLFNLGMAYFLGRSALRGLLRVRDTSLK